MSHQSNRFYRGLATVLLSGSWSSEAMAERLSQSVGKAIPKAKIPRLCERILTALPQRPSTTELMRFLARQFAADFQKLQKSNNPLARFPDTLAVDSPEMSPHPHLTFADTVPTIVTPGQLADWLDVPTAKLEWFADCHGHEATRPREALRHYHYRWHRKRNGSLRLIEIPKSRLRDVQRKILREILNCIPLHEAAHGFCRKRSVVTHAASHCGQELLLRIDLRDFFPSIERRRVHTLFRTIGYPESVCRLLTGLCTNTVPPSVFEGIRDVASVPVDRYRQPHLPQGGPTSPAIANLSAYRLDCRLSGLARSFGASYTRYADDLAFSGDRAFHRRLAKFRVAALAILLCEGFEIRHRKTRVASASRRQQLGGLVTNIRPNLPRSEYDALKAILHNCIHTGAATQNRENHPDFRAWLLGRIGYAAMVNPRWGEKLRAAFEQIIWPELDQE